MTTASTKAAARDWRAEFHDFGDVAYLNVSGQGPLPRRAVRAAQRAVEWKHAPHKLPDSAYFEVPNRVRGHLAALLGARPEEIAVTTGATGGLHGVAHGIEWQPDDEVLIARGEFPAHITTWMPLAASGRLRLVTVEPRERFITAEDFLERMSARTRLVSVSLVRFDDASRLDAAQLAAACREAGAQLLLDVSQCAGAMPLDLRALGADFAVCAGYKWLLSPFGTGFFWIREELIEQMRPAPFYWMALEGAEKFHTLHVDRIQLARGARRWDAPETSSFFNLAAMEASLEFVLEAGAETVWQHNLRLLEMVIERLPRDRCLLASPRDPERRGPYLCVAARTPEKTRELHERLRNEKIYVSLRENALRIAPYLFNTDTDIERLLRVLSV